MLCSKWCYSCFLREASVSAPSPPSEFLPYIFPTLASRVTAHKVVFLVSGRANQTSSIGLLDFLLRLLITHNTNYFEHSVLPTYLTWRCNYSRTLTLEYTTAHAPLGRLHPSSTSRGKGTAPLLFLWKPATGQLYELVILLTRRVSCTPSQNGSSSERWSFEIPPVVMEIY